MVETDTAAPIAPPPSSPRQRPSKGRIVIYVLMGPLEGEERPAVIVAPCNERFPGSSCVRDECQLRLFLDGENDARAGYSGQHGFGDWVTSVPYDESGAPGTWHWPARA